MLSAGIGVQFSLLFYFYAIFLLLLIVDLIGESIYRFLRPSNIILLFTVANFALGNWAFWKGYFLAGHVSKFERVYEFEHLAEANVYIILTLWFIFILSRNLKNQIAPKNQLQLGNKKLVYPFFILLTLFWIFNLQSNLFRILNIAVVISLLQSISKYRVLNLKILLYIIVILGFALISYNDKRNVLLAIFAVLLFEMDFRSYFRWKSVIFGVIASLGFLVLLSVLTILRGYDGFLLSRDMGILPQYVLKFYSNESVISWILHTTESYTTYFHTLQSIEYAIESDKILYGSTLYKALLVPVPSSWMNKPWSIIDHYTYGLYPQFRLVNGALAPNAIGEFFLNFKYLGSLFYLILVYVFDRLYSLMFKSYVLQNIGFWFYIYLLIYVRGSGLDLYLAYVYPSLSFVLLNVLMRKRNFYAWSSHS